MGPNTRVPLFINGFSLSSRTPIGVQTVRLLGPHRDWLHFHWRTHNLRPLDARSILFENPVLGRFHFLRHPKLLPAWEGLGISPWSGSDLRPSLVKRLLNYRERVSSVYAAPLCETDAKRCLKLVNLVGVPFVLHLWDVLHGDVARGALRELVERAESVFCISQPLLDDVSLIREAELLSFSRDASPITAMPREEGALRVAMHGTINCYPEGLDDLDQAIALLEPRGLKVEVSFLGPQRILRRANTTLEKRVNVRGFMPTQQDVDAELGRAHVAFLPGPAVDPGRDMRSRYSIPSRMLDYLAVGLPIVGTVHKASATAGFVRKLGLDATATCSGPAEIAEWLFQLARPERWAEQSARSCNAFDLLQRQEDPAKRLKRALDNIAQPRPYSQTTSVAAAGGENAWYEGHGFGHAVEAQ
jgi:hypothetical protein